MPPKRARSASVKKTDEQAAGATEALVKPHGYEFGGPYAFLPKTILHTHGFTKTCVALA